MDITVVGINHRTAPVEVREKLAFADADIERALPGLLEEAGLSEGLILSTCNRVEIYGVGRAGRDQTRAVRGFLSRYHEIPAREIDPYLYDRVQPGSVGHLFRVACGLDSMVVGETEIFGQVKKAYQKARGAGSVGAVLHRMLQKTFHIGKKVRTETGINEGAVSVSSVAVELAEKIFGGFADKKVMIMGAGETSEATVKHLVERGAASVLASNRSFERARQLAQRFSGEAVPYDAAFSRMREVDIVISSTSAPHPIIQAEKVSEVMRERGRRPMFFIDIAVPRDIEPAVEKLDNVYLYNIDDLKELAGENLKNRQAQIAACDLLIEEEVRRFMRWLEGAGAGRPGR